jgi:hypothetical protein
VAKDRLGRDGMRPKTWPTLPQKMQVDSDIGQTPFQHDVWPGQPVGASLCDFFLLPPPFFVFLVLFCCLLTLPSVNAGGVERSSKSLERYQSSSVRRRHRTMILTKEWGQRCQGNLAGGTEAFGEAERI